jgi:hypothetical protein
MNVRFLEEKNSTNKMEITIDLGSNMEKSVAISSETLEENDLSNPELRNYMKLYDLLEPSDVNHRFLSGTGMTKKARLILFFFLFMC